MEQRIRANHAVVVKAVAGPTHGFDPVQRPAPRIGIASFCPGLGVSIARFFETLRFRFIGNPCTSTLADQRALLP